MTTLVIPTSVPDEVVAGSGCAVARWEVRVADDGVVLRHLGAARRDHELAALTETCHSNISKRV